MGNDSHSATVVRENRDALTFALSVLRHQSETWRHLEPLVRQSESADAVHDMRVAARRMRAAIRGFESVLPENVRSLDAEIRWIGRELGAVRDLDVQIDALDEKSGSHPDLEPLIERLRQERIEARGSLIDALESDRFRAIARVVGMTKPTIAQPAAETTVAEAVRAAAKSARHAARKLGPDSPSTDFHRLRKRAKRLRYLLEISREIYGERAERAIRRLKKLQDVLGDRQDAATALEIAHRLISDPEAPAATANAGERWLRDEEKRERKLRKKALRRLRDARWSRVRLSGSLPSLGCSSRRTSPKTRSS